MRVVSFRSELRTRELILKRGRIEHSIFADSDVWRAGATGCSAAASYGTPSTQLTVPPQFCSKALAPSAHCARLGLLSPLPVNRQIVAGPESYRWAIAYGVCSGVAFSLTRNRERLAFVRGPEPFAERTSIIT